MTLTNGSFRLVAADLDGTLLNPRGELSPRTIATAHALHAAGITLALTTSRRLTRTAPIAAALDLRGPLILYDGAQIRSYPSRAIVAEHPLDAPIAAEATTTLLARGLRPVAQYGDERGERMLAAHAASRDSLDQRYLSLFSEQITFVSEDEFYTRLGAPLRLVAFDALDRLQTATEEISWQSSGWQLLPRGNFGTAELSVFSASASKGQALRALAQRLGIPLEKIFAIGDGINDVSMLSVAGLSVAMGNADRVVQDAAHVVTQTNAEDGAALAIEKFVLNSSGRE